jgi:hypothetical protein
LTASLCAKTAVAPAMIAAAAKSERIIGPPWFPSWRLFGPQQQTGARMGA